jgi:puromycin-sensitive aminopeptidase
VTDQLDPFRLPTTAVPSAYRLRIEPDLDGATFAGTVEIDLELTAPSTTIVLNANGLELDAPTVESGASTTVGTVSLDAEHERATCRFPTELAVGAHTLSMGFRGILNDLLVGFYRSTFTDDRGEEHTIATTQFEMSDARRAFPCFDEPAYKSTFEITLVVAGGLPAYSNSPIVEERDLGGGRREVVFGRTMKMSTYLVAFIVGPFHQTAVVDVDGVPLAVVCRPDQLHLTSYALDVGAFSLRFFKEYFGIPYPGEKVDLVAIPDYPYGAMENLGCVTFRETALLVNPDTASQNELVQIAMVIAHELAHMWFGDLVTMAWWEGIWLNEAFATYMQYVCTAAYKPEWQMWIRFCQEREIGLTVDGLHSTRPIEFPVHSPSDAAAMADVITYQKGGAVLKMLEQFVGFETFRDGLRQYMRTHAYGNTVTRDLWAALESASGEPVGEIMDTWILQGGHPTVSVAGTTLTQRPFMYEPPSGPSAIGSGWIVPVLSRSLDAGGLRTQLLREEPATLAATPPALANAGGVGTYRTSYEPDLLAVIAARLDELTEPERAVLISDTWALARSGERTIADVLTLIAGLGTQPEPAVWDVVDQVFDFLSRAVGDAERPALERKTRTLLGPVFDHFGWERRAGEDERAQIVRGTLIRRLGVTGADEAIRAEAVSRFDAGGLEGDLADSIVAVVGSMDRPGDYEEMRRRFAEAKDPQTEERYRTGLAGIANRARCIETFTTCFDRFRLQDVPVVIARLIVNPVAGLEVWGALTEQWDQIVERIPPVMQFALGMGLMFQVADGAFVARAVAFHKDHPVAGQQRVNQALERLANSASLAARERPTFAATLAP